jgi:hypothetical protein
MPSSIQVVCLVLKPHKHVGWTQKQSIGSNYGVHSQCSAGRPAMPEQAHEHPANWRFALAAFQHSGGTSMTTVRSLQQAILACH